MYKIEEFIKLVESEDFVGGHEILESDWKSVKKSGDKDTAKFLQALINGSTAIALFKRGKKEGCQRVWETFLKYKDLIDVAKLENKDRYEFAVDLLFKKYEKIVKS
jgi:hypothetical protein